MSKSDVADGQPIPKVKIVSLGETRVGKSCLIKRFCEGNRFVTQYIPTIGIDYGARQFTVDNTSFYVHFWDMSGDDSYFEVRNEFYGDTDGFLLVFDMTARETFTQLPRWLEEAKKYGADLSCIVLCGNKCDGSKLAVSTQEAADFAKKNGMPFFDTSAKSGKNISEAFTQLFRTVLAKIKRR
ncbi:small GTP-binding protein, putative [Trichomonas vaginalis G3]|uniref:Small GTP-binding protein, putative n=1 Tax=Trichomonas vaginalis (strain ATCC PRA-98 / G3) TaxID=412133 RepID=A2EDV7_TRIV3|nr:GTPase protein [Trichomonas vaginalis G3]EAY09173.1 small GTP-binding protein, putative [Trichomonas vaginalis G3]KAI5487039.1 GTPase protein [Trichomonas vaginalis G3]|eukprot:XP_001321396.1 small GTP-binding protein [Trichomonas vaginalis G3]